MEINDSIASILQHKASPTVQAVPPDAFVYDAIKLMSDRNIGCVLVMDGDSLLGILSERDYTRKVVLQGRSSKTTTVREIMTGNVICVTPKHGVEETLRIITESRVRHLPVKDGVLITGVLQNGPAAQAGMKPGDVVLTIAGQPVHNTAQLLLAVASLKPQSQAQIGVQRGKDALQLNVLIAQRPKPQATAAR